MYIYVHIYIDLYKTNFVLQIFRSHLGSFFCGSTFTILFSQYFTAQPLIKLSLN